MKIRLLVTLMSIGLVSMGTLSTGTESSDALSSRGWSIDAFAAEPATEPTPDPLPSPPVPPVDPVQNPQPVDSAPAEEETEGAALPIDDDDGFALWDADNSGSLSKAEVEAGPQRYAFARLDRDGDGKVSVEEWERRGEPDADDEDVAAGSARTHRASLARTESPV